jgi:hypothetical protein
MPEFWKRPKFWTGFILVAWLAYIVYENFRLAPVELHLIPFVATLQLRVSAIIIAAAIGGSLLTVGIQLMWRRRASNKGSVSATAPVSSSKTVA